ncbi:hypothetical protein DRW48_15315 [Paracoccus suum]|uniref:Uncharacterized protein n=1 Tax=Paracoccus suum TaxID=2259340 RepID=A0A344PNA8_9RHOB|nr:hypothetical protein [Paracoccus suum]AXC50863.1 hypothetical protein DRW48_15315 [Paracoccus suum]
MTSKGSPPMQIAFHVGLHGTDDERIIRTLNANREALRRAHVELCPNDVNEPILNEALNALKGGVAPPDLEEVLHDALIEDEGTQRLLLSRPTLVGMARRVFDGDTLGSIMPGKMRMLAHTVPSAEVEFFLGLKNPAAHVSQLLARMNRVPPELRARIKPEMLRWAPTVRAMLAELGGRRLIIWCNEDMPLIFPEVVRRFAGLPAGEPLVDDNPLLETLLTKKGYEALAAKLAPLAAADIGRRRALTTAALMEDHDPEAVALTVENLGWDQTIIDRITAAYDADVAEIAALPGVEFISP